MLVKVIPERQQTGVPALVPTFVKIPASLLVVARIDRKQAASTCVIATNPNRLKRLFRSDSDQKLHRSEIAYLLRIFTLLTPFLFGLAGATTVLAAESDELSDLVLALFRHETLSSQWNVEASIDARDGFEGRRWVMGESDGFRLTEVHTGDHCRIYLRNPTYLATIERSGTEGDWYVLHLVTNGAEGSGSDTLFGHQICDPGSVVTAVLEDEISSIVRDGESKLSVTIKENVGSNSEIHPEHYGATVIIHTSQSGGWPEAVSIRPKQGLFTNIAFTKFKEVSAGCKMPVSVKATNIDRASGNSKQTNHYRYNYDRFGSSFDTDRCYLSYYGLPEPYSGLGLGRVRLIVFIFIIGIGVAAYLYRQRFRVATL